MGIPKPVGIDLGTTNTVVAYLDDEGKTSVVLGETGENVTPSVVRFADGEIVVGREAQRLAVLHPDEVARWVKREMGCPTFSRTIRGRRLPPPVIQACILRKARENIVRNVGRESQCVITVPAYFDETRRKATADAGEMAGLRVLDILNEPTAAAIAFGESLGYLSAEGGSRKPMNVLVFDLGGGTFDVTLVHLEPGRIDTLAIDGEMELGGYDWDLALLDDLADEMVAAGFADPRDDPARWAKVYEAVVESKAALTARRKTRFRVMLNEGFFETEITRTRFERCTADLLERTAVRAQNVVEAAGMTWDDVDEVLLVGGATRMPMIPQMLEALSGKKPCRNVNPDEAVARGAAIYAGYRLAKEYPELPVAAFKVVEVNAHTLGVEGVDPGTGGKTKIPIIPRNSKLPVSKTEVFCTERENQDSLAVPVIEGESSDPAACSRIGTVVIERLPPGLPKGWPVLVTFAYRSNGRLDVKVEIPDTDCRAELTIRRTDNLAPEQVARWQSTVDKMPGFDAIEEAVEEILASRSQQESPKVAPAEPPPVSPPSRPPISPPKKSLKAERQLVTREMLLTGADGAAPAKTTPSKTAVLKVPHASDAPAPTVRTADHENNGGSRAFSSNGTRWVPTPFGFSVPRWTIAWTGFVLFSLGGLVLGYFIVRWLLPDSAILDLF